MKFGEKSCCFCGLSLTVANPTAIQGVAVAIHGRPHYFVEIGHGNISAAIHTIPLIREG